VSPATLGEDRHDTDEYDELGQHEAVDMDARAEQDTGPAGSGSVVVVHNIGEWEHDMIEENELQQPL
jgi:hypothetical protein